MENQSLFAKTSCTFVISPCIDPEGKVIDEIWNEGTKHPHVKYYYSGPQECMRIFLLPRMEKIFFK